MAFIYDEPSYTFSEYLLLPGLTKKDCTPDKVSLKTPLVRFRRGQEESPLSINIPMVSAVMQAVSDDKMAIALAKCGGLSFIYVSQPIDQQAEMIARVKKYKSGFVVSDSNLTPEHTLEDVLKLKRKIRTLHHCHNGRRDGERQAPGHRHESGLQGQPHVPGYQNCGIYDAVP